MREGSVKGNLLRFIYCMWFGHFFHGMTDWRGNPICSVCGRYQENDIMV